MRTLAYVRVSTGGQDLGQQKLAILDYARKHRIRVRDFVETHSSAIRASQKEELFRVIDSLRKGDRLLVSELSRLGRSLGQILQIVERDSTARGLGCHQRRHRLRRQTNPAD